MFRYSEVNWNQAACRDMPTNLFYAFEEHRGVREIMRIDIYRNICCACPIWQSCLKYALQNEDYGIWGGMTTHERNALLLGEMTPLLLKVIDDFSERGIDFLQILETLVEHKNNERSVENETSAY